MRCARALHMLTAIPPYRLTALLLLAPCAPLAAQTPDTTRAPAALPDSLDPDSFAVVLPPLGPPRGPMPSANRYVFDQDALRWLGAFTLGDLLQQIPGVMLMRAGWFGQPETVAYMGQAAASVVVFWDGFALDPLGDDSVGFDVGRVALGLVRRVEVEVLPTQLRVHLLSDEQPVRRPRTETSFATGDAGTNMYRARYINRWRSGTGLALAADWFGTEGPATSPGKVRHLTLWGKATWAPSPRVGVAYQVLRLALERDANPGTGEGPPLSGVDLSRNDAVFRAYAATREDGTGLRFDALVGVSRYRDSSGLETEREQLAASASYRSATWSGELTTRLRSGLSPVELRLAGAWAPRRRWLVAGHVQQTDRLGAARSLEAGATVQWRVGNRLALHGSVRWRDERADPSVVGDTSQQVTDWRWGVVYLSPRADVGLSLARHGYFVAPSYAVFRSQLPRTTDIDVVSLTAALHIRPRLFLTLSGWYRHPLDPIRAAYEPPHHARLLATFRSRFLPHFRRGVFDLLLQAEMEGWSDGVAGLDQAGAELRLEGATAVNYLVEFRLVGAILFWTLRNPQLERYAVVPGFPMARGLQRFGVRWEFTN